MSTDSKSSYTIVSKPSYTNDDLRNAIDNKNRELVQKILAERNPAGIPWVDINKGSFGEPTMLLYATSLFAGRVDYEICKALLTTCDNQDRPVTNLNVTNSANATVVSNILGSASFSNEDKTKLLKLIVDYRTPEGDPVYDVTFEQYAKPLLLLAIETRDFDLVNMFVDWRKKDGTHMFDVNATYYAETPLDCINELLSAEKAKKKKTSVVLSDIRDLLLSYGALTCAQVKEERANAKVAEAAKKFAVAARVAQDNNNLGFKDYIDDRVKVSFDRVSPPLLGDTKHDMPQLSSRPVANPAAGISPGDLAREEYRQNAPNSEIKDSVAGKAKSILNAEVDKFSEHRQNTHNMEVEASVAASIIKLKKRYPSVDINRCFSEIKSFIDALPDKDNKDLANKQTALISFARTNGIQFKGVDQGKVSSGLHHREIIALVWTGVLDAKAFSPDNPKADMQQIIKTRKEAFVQKLIAAQTEYPTSYSCVGGTRNFIVETLNHAHPDVSIVYTKTMEYGAFISLLSGQFAEEYKKQPLEKQKQIRKYWEKDTDPAAAFRKSFKTHIDKQIREAKFKDEDREKIYSVIFESPPPVDAKLQVLLDSIGGLYFTPDKPLYSLAQKIKNLADKLCDDEKKSYEDEYKFLNSEYQSFKKERESLDVIVKFCNQYKVPVEPLKIDEKKSFAEISSEIKAVLVKKAEPFAEDLFRETDADFKQRKAIVIAEKGRDIVIKKMEQYQKTIAPSGKIDIEALLKWRESNESLKKIDMLAMHLQAEMKPYSSSRQARQQACADIYSAIEKAYLTFKVGDKGKSFKEFKQTVERISRDTQAEYEKSSYTFSLATFFSLEEKGKKSALSSKIDAAVKLTDDKLKLKK